jgi:hypothetical protein
MPATLHSLSQPTFPSHAHVFVWNVGTSCPIVLDASCGYPIQHGRWRQRMPSIEPRKIKDGRTVYRVKVRRKGLPEQTATFHRLTDARNWAQITEAAILEGRYFKTSASKRHTLADMVDRYLREVLPRKSASSIYMQTQQLRWWKAHLGHHVLADVTPALIAEYRDKLASEDDTCRSNATVRRYLAALSHAFTTAVKEWGWIDHSPLRNVSKPKEPRGRVRFLSDQERERLLDACRGSENRS